MTLAFVLAAADVDAALAIAAAARAAHHDVALFVMDDAVPALPRMAALVDDGCEVIACATSLTRHGLAAPDGVVAGSQDDHARLVRSAARVLAFC